MDNNMIILLDDQKHFNLDNFWTIWPSIMKNALQAGAGLCQRT
jgi:hypothetical protein